MSGKAPTPDEMRRVADFMSVAMNLHSAAGKLYARAARIEASLKDESIADLQQTRPKENAP